MRPPVSATTIVDTAQTRRHGRISSMRTEFLRLLSERVPDVVREVNDREGVKIPVPVRFYLKDEELKDLKFPAVVVDSSMRFEPLGNALKKVHTVNVIILVGTKRSREDVDNSTDLAELVDFAVMPSLVNQRTPEGNPVWNVCAPTTISGLSDDWKTYSGSTVTYTVDQAGCVSLWAKSPS